MLEGFFFQKLSPGRITKRKKHLGGIIIFADEKAIFQNAVSAVFVSFLRPIFSVKVKLSDRIPDKVEASFRQESGKKGN